MSLHTIRQFPFRLAATLAAALVALMAPPTLAQWAESDLSRPAGCSVDNPTFALTELYRTGYGDGLGEPLRSAVHAAKAGGVRQGGSELWFQERGSGLRRYASVGEYTRGDVRNPLALGDRCRCSGITRPLTPGAAPERARDAEEGFSHSRRRSRPCGRNYARPRRSEPCRSWSA